MMQTARRIALLEKLVALISMTSERFLALLKGGMNARV
jgi:hypothetical protein